MLSSPIVPADSVRPASYFLDVLDTPAALALLRLVLAALAVGLCGMYLYARKKSREEERQTADASRS